MIAPVEEAKKMIFDSTIEMGTDFAEIGIDMLFEDSFIKDIPILGTIYKLGEVSYSISRVVYIKKMLVFAQELQRKDISKEVLKKHRKLLETDKKKYYDELEFLISYIERQVGYEKSLYMARVYYIYLSEKIDYDDLTFLWEIIDQFSVNDKESLIELFNEESFENGHSYYPISLKRLSNCGLIDFYNGIAIESSSCEKGIIASITDIGKFFCENILLDMNILDEKNRLK